MVIRANEQHVLIYDKKVIIYFPIESKPKYPVTYGKLPTSFGGGKKKKNYQIIFFQRTTPDETLKPTCQNTQRAFGLMLFQAADDYIEAKIIGKLEKLN